MTGICAVCARSRPVHVHHMTGRPAPGASYFDGGLTIPLCPECHVGAGGTHAVLRTVRLEWPAPGVDFTAHRLRRVAIHVALVADAGRPFVVEPTSARGLAALLREAARAVEGDR